MRSKKLLSAVFAAGLALAAGSASAGVTWFSPITAFQDDDLDYVVDNNSNGAIDVGDRLISILEYGNSQGVLAGQGPNGFAPHELTGVSDITIVGIGAGGVLILGPSGAAGLLAGYAPGTTGVVFLDATPDLNVINAACGTRAQCAALAGLGLTDGSAEYFSIGFFGDPDESWVSGLATGGGVITTVEGGGSSTIYASVNLQQSIGINNTGYTFGVQSCGAFCGLGGDGLVQVTGTANVLGGQSLDHAQWTARSDSDLQLVPIPEPGSLAMLGIALAGLGLMRRRAQ